MLSCLVQQVLRFVSELLNLRQPKEPGYALYRVKRSKNSVECVFVSRIGFERKNVYVCILKVLVRLLDEIAKQIEIEPFKRSFCALCVRCISGSRRLGDKRNDCRLVRSSR